MKLSSGAVLVFLANAVFDDVLGLVSSTPCAPSPYHCTQWSRSSSCLAMQGDSGAENFLRLAEELSSGQNHDWISHEVVTKMEEIEPALTSFVEEKRAVENLQPRPPGIPPPLYMFQSSNTPSGLSQEDAPVMAQIALEKVRERLNGSGLEGVDDSLLRPLQEEDVLRRVEEVLRRSRESAEKRKLDAIKAGIQPWQGSEMMMASPVDEPMEGSSPDIPSNQILNRGLQGPRTTIPLDALGGPTNTRGGAVRDGSVWGSGSVPSPNGGVPIITNWIHCADGSIRGQVYNSDKFSDGAEILTSLVSGSLSAGTMIETFSGSRYFLYRPANEDRNGVVTNQNPVEESGDSTWTLTPNVIPAIVAWKLLDSGGIAGLLYNCTRANDGDYVETSPIASGIVASGQVVVTASGSQYFLSPLEDDRNSNIVAAFQDMSTAVPGSTITLSNELGRRNLGASEGFVDSASRRPRRRSTYSLFSLMGNKREPRTGGATGPHGVPMLSQWRVNPDRTITGTVSGSTTLCDGDVITTSEIAKGIPERNGKVITASGSIYFLA